MVGNMFHFTNWKQALRRIFLNKYVIVFMVFFVFILFFDQHNLIRRYKTYRNTQKLKSEINFYNEQIKNNRKEINNIQLNDESLEKYARERYFMKKDSEDIFIIKEKE